MARSSAASAPQVIASNDERYPRGAAVTGLTGWQDYVLTGGADAPLRVLGAGVTPRHALGVFGVTGMAAYFGMLDVGRVRAGDTVVVSGAAGPVTYFNLVLRSGRMEGFLVRDYVDRFAEARADMAPWIADGRLEHAGRVIDGLEHAPEALHMLFTGVTSGKLVVRV